jgi:hypothetical protein
LQIAQDSVKMQYRIPTPETLYARARRNDNSRDVDDIDAPKQTRVIRETHVKLHILRSGLRRLVRKQSRRTSPQTAQTSPKPPVSAWESAGGGTAALLGLGNAPSFLAIGDGPSGLSIAKNQEGQRRRATHLAVGAWRFAA